MSEVDDVTIMDSERGSRSVLCSVKVTARDGTLVLETVRRMISCLDGELVNQEPEEMLLVDTDSYGSLEKKSCALSKTLILCSLPLKTASNVRETLIGCIGAIELRRAAHGSVAEACIEIIQGKCIIHLRA